MLRVTWLLAAFALGAGACAPVTLGTAADASADANTDAAHLARDVQSLWADELGDVVVPMLDVVVLPYDGSSEATIAADAGTSSDAAADPCPALADAYAAALQQTLTCTDSSQCTASLCETPCCTCMVFVNADEATHMRARGLLELWHNAGCAARASCRPEVCGAPQHAACSTEGRCVTLRATP